MQGKVYQSRLTWKNISTIFLSTTILLSMLSISN